VAHLRYPEDLFRIQTAAYSKYRLDPADFFERKGAWSVALAAPEQPRTTATATDGTTANTVAVDAGSTQFAADSTATRFEPYYTMFHADGGDDAEFRLFRPFQPFSTSDRYLNLVAYMTASSDPATYGQLVAYELPSGAEEDGPYIVGAAMNSDPNVSAYATLNSSGGSTVEFGDLQMLPVGDGVIWFRPLYVESQSSGQPLVNKMIVNYKGKVAMGDSFGEALAELFPGFNATIGDVTSGGATDPGDGTDDPDEPSADATAAELLTQADELFQEADQAIKNGDWGLYGEKIAAARDLVERALALLEAQG